jgi:hypothetical protein
MATVVGIGVAAQQYSLRNITAIVAIENKHLVMFL